MSVGIRRCKWHNPCPPGIYSLAKNPSLTLEGNAVGGCVLLAVSAADQRWRWL